MTVVVFMVVSTVLGWMIGSSKGKAGAGQALGLLLGPLGVVITLFLKADRPAVAGAGDTTESAGNAEMQLLELPSCCELRHTGVQ